MRNDKAPAILALDYLGGGHVGGVPARDLTEADRAVLEVAAGAYGLTLADLIAYLLASSLYRAAKPAAKE